MHRLYHDVALVNTHKGCIAIAPRTPAQPDFERVGLR